jgi:hypothetical protein
MRERAYEIQGARYQFVIVIEEHHVCPTKRSEDAIPRCIARISRIVEDNDELVAGAHLRRRTLDGGAECPPAGRRDDDRESDRRLSHREATAAE